MATGSTTHKGSTGQKADIPSQRSGASAGRKRQLPGVHPPRVRMPAGTAANVLWWGGLAAVAAFGVVDWPVVALVAAGSWVAEQHANQLKRAEDSR